MDLVSYLRPLRKWLVVFVVLAIGVGAGTAYLVWRSTETTYRATLELSLPTFTGQPRELEQLTADYFDAITTPRVVDAAAAASGLDADELRDSLGAQRSTEFGSGVRVEATGADAGRLSRAVPAATEEAYRQLAQPRLDAAGALAERLQTEYEEAQISTEGATPDQVRRQSQLEFAALRAVSDARAEVLDLEILVDQVEDAASPEAVEIAQVDETWPIVQAGLTNGGATLFALVALLVAVELWRTRPSRRPAAPADDETPGSPAGETAPDRPARVATAKKVPVPPPAGAADAEGGADGADAPMTPGKGKRKSQLAGSSTAGTS